MFTNLQFNIVIQLREINNPDIYEYLTLVDKQAVAESHLKCHYLFSPRLQRYHENDTWSNFFVWWVLNLCFILFASCLSHEEEEIIGSVLFHFVWVTRLRSEIHFKNRDVDTIEDRPSVLRNRCSGNQHLTFIKLILP